MSSVRVELTGDADRLLRRMYQLSNIDKKGMMNTLAESIRTSTVERFAEERSPEGKKWKPSIRARTEGGKTLTKSAGLKSSIHSEAGESGFAVGTNTIYAATHQFGASRTIRASRKKYLRFQIRGRFVSVKEVHVNIPARPFLGISEEDQQEIRDMLQAAFEEQ